MIGPTDLLATWESGLAAGTLQRALMLHALVRRQAVPYGQQPPGVEELLAVPVGQRDADLLAVPVGQRDADLLALRRALFGERLNARLTCVGCGEELELDVDVAGLIEAGAAAADPVTVEAGPWRLRLRPPTSGDLVAVSRLGSPDRARAALLARCVLGAERDGQPADTGTLPEDVARRAVAAIGEADPCADIRLTVQCVQCGQQVRSALDIVSFLWAELDAWARATLLDIHLLAAAYGWSEAESLAVSPTRRRYYLELAGHA